MAEVYELNDFQHVSLVRMANLDHQMLMAVDEKDDDDADTKKRLSGIRERCSDLVGLGLVEDKTGDFIEHITKSAMMIGRSSKVYLITKLGRQMFQGVWKEQVN